MSETLGPFELRAKCTERMHKKFHTFAMAAGRDATEVLRELAGRWIEEEEHAHILRCRLLKGEGIDVDAPGNDP